MKIIPYDLKYSDKIRQTHITGGHAYSDRFLEQSVIQKS